MRGIIGIVAGAVGIAWRAVARHAVGPLVR